MTRWVKLSLDFESQSRVYIKVAHTLAYLIGQFQSIWSVQTKSLKYLSVSGVLQIKSGTSDRSFWSSIMLEFLTRQQILSVRGVAGSGRDVTDLVPTNQSL